MSSQLPLFSHTLLNILQSNFGPYSSSKYLLQKLPMTFTMQNPEVLKSTYLTCYQYLTQLIASSFLKNCLSLNFPNTYPFLIYNLFLWLIPLRILCWILFILPTFKFCQIPGHSPSSSSIPHRSSLTNFF